MDLGQLQAGGQQAGPVGGLAKPVDLPADPAPPRAAGSLWHCRGRIQRAECSCSCMFVPRGLPHLLHTGLVQASTAGVRRSGGWRPPPPVRSRTGGRSGARTYASRPGAGGSAVHTHACTAPRQAAAGWAPWVPGWPRDVTFERNLPRRHAGMRAHAGHAHVTPSALPARAPSRSLGCSGGGAPRLRAVRGASSLSRAVLRSIFPTAACEGVPCSCTHLGGAGRGSQGCRPLTAVVETERIVGVLVVRIVVCHGHRPAGRLREARRGLCQEQHHRQAAEPDPASSRRPPAGGSGHATTTDHTATLCGRQHAPPLCRPGSQILHG